MESCEVYMSRAGLPRLQVLLSMEAPRRKAVHFSGCNGDGTSRHSAVGAQAASPCSLEMMWVGQGPQGPSLPGR